MVGDKDKEKFLNDCDDLKKPYIFNKKYVKVGYGQVWIYIYWHWKPNLLKSNKQFKMKWLWQFSEINIDNKKNMPI